MRELLSLATVSVLPIHVDLGVAQVSQGGAAVSVNLPPAPAAVQRAVAIVDTTVAPLMNAVQPPANVPPVQVQVATPVASVNVSEGGTKAPVQVEFTTPLATINVSEGAAKTPVQVSVRTPVGGVTVTEGGTKTPVPVVIAVPPTTVSTGGSPGTPVTGETGGGSGTPVGIGTGSGSGTPVTVSTGGTGATLGETVGGSAPVTATGLGSDVTTLAGTAGAVLSASPVGAAVVNTVSGAAVVVNAAARAEAFVQASITLPPAAPLLTLLSDIPAGRLTPVLIPAVLYPTPQARAETRDVRTESASAATDEEFFVVGDEQALNEAYQAVEELEGERAPVTPAPASPAAPAASAPTAVEEVAAPDVFAAYFAETDQVGEELALAPLATPEATQPVTAGSAAALSSLFILLGSGALQDNVWADRARQAARSAADRRKVVTR